MLGMYEWLFAPPGSVPPAWDPERARDALTEAIESPSRAWSWSPSTAASCSGFATAYLELELGPLRAALLGRGPRRQPRAPLAGSRQGAARRGQGLGAGARRHAPRARQRRGAHRRPPLLRARGARLERAASTPGCSEALAAVGVEPGGLERRALVEVEARLRDRARRAGARRVPLAVSISTPSVLRRADLAARGRRSCPRR